MGRRRPTIIRTRKPLLFDALEPGEFERMCLWLVEREGYVRAEHVGETGSDQGRDVVAYKPRDGREELWYFQCKRRKRIGPKELKKDVDKIHALAADDPAKRPAGIVFVTSASVSPSARDEVGSYCRRRGCACEFWAHTELDMRVKKHPKIKEEFFAAGFAPPPDALHQLPPRPEDFTGRGEELKQLLADVGKGGAIISCLRGMAGVGKTALALVLADDLKPRYPDAQFLLDLKGAGDQPLTPGEAMAHVIRGFRPEAELPEEEGRLAGLYRSVLHEKRAIVLMDNAADAAQVRALIPPETSVLLVTSRQRFALPGLKAVNLAALPADDACELLLKICGRIGDHAEVIAERCGYLPLALRAAASLLEARADLDPGQYAEQLEDERTRLRSIGKEGGEPDVEASLKMSYDLLPKETARVFRLASVFGGSFTGSAAEEVCKDQGHKRISELVGYSLVEWNEAARRYRLHDLVRLFASARLRRAERRSAQRRHAEHYRDVLDAADEMYLKGGDGVLLGLKSFDLEWGNIAAGQAWAAANVEGHRAAAKLCSRYPNAGVYCLSLRLHPRERIRWLEAAVAAARRLNDREGEGWHLCNLGNAYAALGETRRAIEYYEQDLAIAREVGDRRGEGMSLGNLGNAYADLGETRRAMEYYEQDLAIAREVGDRRGEGTALGNLGVAYADLGEARRAIEYHEQYLAIAREMGDRRGEGMSLCNLGLAYADLGETRRAIEYHEQDLAIAREVGDRRGEGMSLGNLGLTYADLGETPRAVEYHEHHLAIAREVGDRRGEGTALWNMSLALDELGEREKAIGCAAEALPILEQIEHPNAEKVRRQLAEWRGKG